MTKRYATPTQIRPTAKKLKMWNSTTGIPIGESTELTFNPKNKTSQDIDFVICENGTRLILGLQACEALSVIRVCEENFERISLAGPVEEINSVGKRIGSFPGIH